MVFPIIIILPIPFVLTDFSNTDIDAINSPNNTVIAPNEPANLLESIIDMINNAAASMAIAVAISLRVLAFNCCVKASNASPAPPIISLMFSRIPPALSKISPPDFINRAISTPMAENIPPLRISKRAL